MYDLVGVDGNAFSIMGYVRKAMMECRKPKAEIDAYHKEAMSSDYDSLVYTSFEMVEKLNKEMGYTEEDGDVS
jgi:hypothetical protein